MMKWLFLALVLFSCKEKIVGKLDVYEKIEITENEMIEEGSYHLDLTLKKNKAILKLGDKKVKLKYKNFDPIQPGRFEVSDEKFNYVINGDYNIQASQPQTSERTVSCSYTVPFTYVDLICFWRGGRRFCRRALRTSFRLVWGEQRVSFTQQEEIKRVQADIVSKNDRNIVAQFDSEEVRDISFREVLTDCY